MSDLLRNLEQFNQAETSLGQQLYAPDRTSEIIRNTEDDVFTRHRAQGQDFYDVSFAPCELLGHSGEFSQLLGRIILFPNSRLGVFSPGIVQPLASEIQLTMLDQPFDTKVGLSEGQHFGLSAEAQTRASGFGEHGAGKFEAGHFGTVLVAARSERLAGAIVNLGDAATHDVLDKGLVGVMNTHDMLPLQYRHSRLPMTSDRKVTAFWHPALGGEHGPAQADYADATKIVLGAGVAAVGRRGIDRARRLADDAFRV